MTFVKCHATVCHATVFQWVAIIRLADWLNVYYPQFWSGRPPAAGKLRSWKLHMLRLNRQFAGEKMDVIEERMSVYTPERHIDRGSKALHIILRSVLNFRLTLVKRLNV